METKQTVESLSEMLQSRQTQLNRLTYHLTAAQSRLANAQSELANAQGEPAREQESFNALEAQAKREINAYIDAYMPQLAAHKYAEDSEGKGCQDEVDDHPIFKSRPSQEGHAEAADVKLVVENIASKIAGCESADNVFKLFKQNFACGPDGSNFSNAVKEMATFFFKHKALLNQSQEQVADSQGFFSDLVASVTPLVNPDEIRQRLRHFVSYMQNGNETDLTGFLFAEDVYRGHFAELSAAHGDFMSAKDNAFTGLEDKIDQVQAHRTRIEDAQSRLNNLQGQVNDLSEQVNKLQGRIGAADAKAATTTSSRQASTIPGGARSSNSDNGDNVGQNSEINPGAEANNELMRNSLSAQNNLQSSAISVLGSSNSDNGDNEEQKPKTNSESSWLKTAGFFMVGAALGDAAYAAGLEVAAALTHVTFAHQSAAVAAAAAKIAGGITLSAGLTAALPWVLAAGVVGVAVVYGLYRLQKHTDDASPAEEELSNRGETIDIFYQTGNSELSLSR